MFDQENYNQLIYWITERYNILQKKKMGLPAPWSDNKVMQETYFCNVHREDDKVTKYIRNKFDQSNGDYPEFNMTLARMVNKPESLEKMGWPFDNFGSLNQAKFLDVMSQKGAWGSAYIVSTNGRAMPKHEYICDVLRSLFVPLSLIHGTSTLASTHKALMGLQGLGSFMAAQIVADLKNTKGHPLNTAPDWWKWCAPGPGSLRGMAWVKGKDKVTPTEFSNSIPELAYIVGADILGDVPKLCWQDLQNCLCEYDKFMRVTNGTGRSKRRYNGTAR